MMCTHPYIPSEYPDLRYPCGRCLNCRISKREEWTTRMVGELEYWNKAMFVTLTYDEKHIPIDGGLRIEDLQNFFKRLRRNIDRSVYGRDHKIKYFACGEYGGKNHRCHYHAIIFGLDWSDSYDRELIKQSWKLCAPHMWRSRFQRGRMRGAIAPVVPESIRYVTGYVYKKAVDNSTDIWRNAVYDRTGISLQKVFQLQSQGIGLRWAQDHADSIRRNGYVRCMGRKPIPRYYRKKLGIMRFNTPAFAKQVENQQKRLMEFSKLDLAARKNFYRTVPTMARIVAGYNKHMQNSWSVSGKDCDRYLDKLVCVASDPSLFPDFDERDYSVMGYYQDCHSRPDWVTDNLDYDILKDRASNRRYRL